MYPRIRLVPGRERSVQFKHPWLFSRAIAQMPGKIEDGSIVTVESASGQILGTGYYNSRSQIAVRLFTFGREEEIDENFFVERLRTAVKLREQFLDLKNTNAYRLVFSESDGIPGLILDRYNDFLVFQIHTLGMEKLREPLIKALQKVFKKATQRVANSSSERALASELQLKGIYERSDLEVRKKEGLKIFPIGVVAGEEPPALYEVQEHGLKFYVDIKTGQKTGFFLDQRENRFAIRTYCKGKTVLNLFGYTGGFSLSALHGGAEKVITVDIANPALQIARKNFELNNFDPSKHEFITQDVFLFLDECIKQKRKFDIVIVDPPAFVKTKESLNNAVNAYIRLNQKALQVLAQGGILVSSSCSSHVPSELFRTILFKAANQVSAELILLETKTQPADHPLNINFPEGEYLKFFICNKKSPQ